MRHRAARPRWYRSGHYFAGARMALDRHAYFEGGIFLGACALIGSGVGLLVGLLRGPREWRRP